MQQEQELFQSYELKGWGKSPRVYKILGVSTLVSLFSLFVIGQTQLLTTKGCDSPFVGQVCNVLDTLYVGGSVIAADTSTIDEPYTQSELADADITFVNLDQQFKYPEGYFALSNPIPTDPMFDPNNPANAYIPDPSGVIPNPTLGGTNDLLNKPQELPQTNNNPIIGNLPTSPLGTDNPIAKRPKWRKNLPKNPTITNTSPNTLPKIDEDQTAKTDNQNVKKNEQPQVNPTPEKEEAPKADQNGIVKNKKPLNDFGEKALPKVKNIKLDAPFTVVVAGDLDQSKENKDITILKNPKLVKSEVVNPSDAELAKLVQDAILAVGDSGWLGYMKLIGAKNIVFTLAQNENELTANIQADYDDENKAKTGASTLGAFILVGRNTTDGDEKVLLEKAQSNHLAGTKSSVLSFTIPKDIAKEMITRRLEKIEKERKEKEQKQQSTAQLKEKNQAAVK